MVKYLVKSGTGRENELLSHPVGLIVTNSHDREDRPLLTVGEFAKQR